MMRHLVSGKGSQAKDDVKADLFQVTSSMPVNDGTVGLYVHVRHVLHWQTLADSWSFSERNGTKISRFEVEWLG